MAGNRVEHNTKRVTYTVALTPNWGATLGEVQEQMRAIEAEYTETAKAYPAAPPAADGIHVAYGKDEIVLYFILEDRK